MIRADQPTIFGTSLTIGLSSVSDGNMRDVGTLDAATIKNYDAFISHLPARPLSTTYQLIRFKGADYCRYQVVAAASDDKKGGGIAEPVFADGLATTSSGHALFLPIADCTPAVLYDPVKKALMISHLGRHSTEQKGAVHSVEFMTQSFGSRPENILVWLGPSPNGDEYPLWARGNQSFRDVNTEDMLAAGITGDHLEISPIDTVHDKNYFSHSEFLKGHRATDGRFAVVAMITL